MRNLLVFISLFLTSPSYSHDVVSSIKSDPAMCAGVVFTLCSAIFLCKSVQEKYRLTNAFNAELVQAHRNALANSIERADSKVQTALGVLGISLIGIACGLMSRWIQDDQPCDQSDLAQEFLEKSNEEPVFLFD